MSAPSRGPCSPAFDLNHDPDPGPKDLSTYLSTAIDFTDTRARGYPHECCRLRPPGSQRRTRLPRSGQTSGRTLAQRRRVTRAAAAGPTSCSPPGQLPAIEEELEALLRDLDAYSWPGNDENSAGSFTSDVRSDRLSPVAWAAVESSVTAGSIRARLAVLRQELLVNSCAATPEIRSPGSRGMRAVSNPCQR